MGLENTSLPSPDYLTPLLKIDKAVTNTTFEEALGRTKDELSIEDIRKLKLKLLEEESKAINGVFEVTSKQLDEFRSTLIAEKYDINDEFSDEHNSGDGEVENLSDPEISGVINLLVGEKETPEPINIPEPPKEVPGKFTDEFGIGEEANIDESSNTSIDEEGEEFAIGDDNIGGGIEGEDSGIGSEVQTEGDSKDIGDFIKNTIPELIAGGLAWLKGQISNFISTLKGFPSYKEETIYNNFLEGLGITSGNENLKEVIKTNIGEINGTLNGKDPKVIGEAIRSLIASNSTIDDIVAAITNYNPDGEKKPEEKKEVPKAPTEAEVVAEAKFPLEQVVQPAGSNYEFIRVSEKNNDGTYSMIMRNKDGEVLKVNTPDLTSSTDNWVNDFFYSSDNLDEADKKSLARADLRNFEKKKGIFDYHQGDGTTVKFQNLKCDRINELISWTAGGTNNEGGKDTSLLAQRAFDGLKILGEETYRDKTLAELIETFDDKEAELPV